ncbi:MAG: hypothetical protein ACRD12_09150 [Acidimicrobiales bacterium]
MTWMSVFVVLGLLWAAVLVPPLLRARAERRAEFIDSFSRQMGALGRKAVVGRDTGQPAAPRPRPAPRPMTLLARPTNPTKRRRDVLGGLLGAMIGSGVLGFIPSLRSVWILFLFLVNLFIAYIALLAHNRRHRARMAHHAALRPERALAPAPSR